MAKSYMVYKWIDKLHNKMIKRDKIVDVKLMLTIKRKWCDRKNFPDAEN